MAKWTVSIDTHGSAAFSGVEADTEEEAIAKAWAVMHAGKEPCEHNWEYGHKVGGCGPEADATEESPSPESKGRVRAQKKAKSDPVCEHCKDTHLVRDSRYEHKIMCQWCPTPCEECREGPSRAFCTTTPCGCDCHATPGLRGGES